MRKVSLELLTTFIVFFVLTSITSAQTEVSGSITSSTAWTKAISPYFVRGTINVYPGATLTIEPGVIVKLDSAVSIQIGGELIANGTDTDSIFFLSNIDNVRWGTIKFTDSSIDAAYDSEGNYLSGSKIEYARIEGAENGGIYLDHASPFIANNMIINNSTGSRNVGYYGCGIYCYYSSPKIFKNNIRGNSAYMGGGIYCYASSALILENNISDNLGFDGGGIYLYLDSTPTISKNNIINNYSANGGGIYCKGGITPNITENVISNNSAEFNGGGIYCWNASPSISNNTISDNIAIYSAVGGNNTYGKGGGIFLGSFSSASILDNTISSDTANYEGGGVYCKDSSPTILRNTISENIANNNGGGIVCEGSAPIINHNNIHNNSSYNIYVKTNSTENINAQNNWWGINEKDSIEVYIYDYWDDITLSKVIYEPFLTSLYVPVELISFTFKIFSNSIKIIWETVSETNNYGFEIEKSIDSINFRKIGFVKGNGTTSKRFYYTFIDKDLSSSIFYYRLKQIDFNGSCNYSRIIKSEMTIPCSNCLLQNYPNPFNPETTIQYQILKESHVTLKVYNINGQLIKTLLNEEISPGSHSTTWDGNDNSRNKVSSGIYIYILKTSTGYTESKKMLLLK